jgi:hypothetical protein
MTDWLLPVSRYTRFTQTSGRAIDNASFDSLAGAALAGRLGKVVCDVRGPLIEVEAGDTIWLYTDDVEAGVFAFGRAGRHTKGQSPTFTITLDKTRTRTLAIDPLPATSIRRWVPELRQGAVALDLRPRAQTVLDSWQRERGDRDAELLGPIGATPWRSLSLRTSTGRHPARDNVYGPIARLLRSQDFALGMVDGFGSAPWLVGRRVRDVVTIHVQRAKTRLRAHALAEFGPLRDFRWRVERDTSRDVRLRTSLWIAFITKPPEDVCDFLEDEDVLVSWQHKSGSVELTDRSKQRWYQYLGVR